MGSTDEKQAWGSRLGLILAMAGSAVGLANFLRFPIQAVENGGGAFLIPYLVCFVIMGVPLLWVEWSLGRFGGKSGHHSTPFMFDKMTKGWMWKFTGVFGIFTNMVVIAYYSYIESWSMGYIIHTVIGTFNGANQTAVAEVFNNYTSFLGGSVGGSTFSLIIFLATLFINVYILSKGISGIEKVAKIGMPLLLAFGAILAVKGLTLGTSGASEAVPDANAWEGLNFLWEVEFSSILEPEVWLAAAGQIFFTLGLGWGFVQAYASYLKAKDDVALNALAAGFTNEFVEIVIGSLILIPLAAGYLGMDWVKENADFGMAFQTMPYLFDQLGSVLGPIAGVLWFGLLFFAGITSSLAMGTPWMGFFESKFNWSRSKSAWSLGLVALLLGLPAVVFYEFGVLDEFDYWVGTVSLVVLAMIETVIFSWVFGVDRGWKEITEGAEINVPKIFKFLLRYITPTLIIIVFLAAVITPEGNDWIGAINGLFHGEGWSLDSGSIISKMLYVDLNQQLAEATDPDKIELLKNKILYSKISRAILTVAFIFIGYLVHLASKRMKNGDVNLNN